MAPTPTPGAMDNTHPENLTLTFPQRTKEVDPLLILHAIPICVIAISFILFWGIPTLIKIIFTPSGL